jgi:hypothetical protein
MNVVIDDELEEYFRKQIADSKGLRKGNISEALEEAIQLWIQTEKLKREKGSAEIALPDYRQRFRKSKVEQQSTR